MWCLHDIYQGPLSPGVSNLRQRRRERHPKTPTTMWVGRYIYRYFGLLYAICPVVRTLG